MKSNDTTASELARDKKCLIPCMFACMVNIKLKYNFLETPRKFVIICDDKFTWCFHKNIF